MAGMSKDQAEAAQRWLQSHNYTCPVCKATPDRMRLNGTIQSGYNPFPDGTPNGGTATMAYVECMNCAYVLLVDCDTAHIPHYR